MKTIRLLFGLSLVGAVIFVGWKIVPVYFSNYQFEQGMNDIARVAVVDAKKGPDEIRAKVVQTAQSLDIPIDPEAIEVVRNGNDVSISADYSVTIDVPVYPITLKFHPSTNWQGLNLR